jgi:RNA polymerase-associated protein RTF1
MEDIDEYGPDLYKDEEDRKRLQALPEVERERILAERSEERQRNLERLEVRKLLKDGRREDITRRRIERNFLDNSTY